MNNEDLMDAGYSLYGWIIDFDHITDHRDEEGSNCNAAGLMGPGNPQMLNEIVEALQNGEGTKFRMLDDDGDAYYYGRIIDLNTDPGYDNGFTPLEDFGTPNAGCTTIAYLLTNPETGREAWQEL